jgi:hypothetical protein
VQRLAPLEKKARRSRSGDLEAAVEAMKNVTWTALEELKAIVTFSKKSPTPKRRSNHYVKPFRPDLRHSGLMDRISPRLTQRKHVADQELRYCPGAHH